MEPAPIEWAVTDACGDFPCTAPKNTVLSFKNNQFSGTQPSFSNKNKFQVVPKNVGVTETYDLCEEISAWNGFYCRNNKLAMLVFENLDEDAFDRAV